MRIERTEKSISAAFVRKVRERGYSAIKLSTLGLFGTSGWPDYLILGPERWVAFIELKTPRGKLTRMQSARLETLQHYGFPANVARSVAEALILGLPA